VSFKPTACILCSINCGLEVATEGRRITRIRGNKRHPASKGYLCEKAGRLDHYQNGRDRLTSPMRRAADGTYEAVDWDTAIREVSERLAAVRDAHGGQTILHYGGGAQGNHLGGAFGRATRAALGCRYTSNALAQEKTGEFWVDGQLFGRARCHTVPDFENAEVAVFVGKNPWQSHGFPRARKVLKDIAKDPARALIVIDPRRTETAAMADIHLQVRPGGDAWLLVALLRVLLDEGLTDDGFLAARTNGLEDLRGELSGFDVAACCDKAGVPLAQVQAAARRLAGASSASILEDLGIQQAPHSTLNSWLEKLAVILTGNFGKPGGMNIHTRFASLGGGKGDRRGGSPVHGHRLIAGLIPCNAIAEEILTDHPDRFRALIVESANPVHSLADSPRMREAVRSLEFSVVIDVAMTETAREADYVLPASSQFEKWECTFFNLEFPHNVFHLRPPLLEALPGTLPEGEIHARLLRALGAFDGLPLDSLREAAAQGIEAYAMAFLQATATDPRVMRLAPALLRETMAAALPEGAEDTAPIWGLALSTAQAYPGPVAAAGFAGPTPIHQGTALFLEALRNPDGVVFTVDEDPEISFKRVETPDKRIRLTVPPELLDELRSLASTSPAPRNDRFPLILTAGVRRSGTANTLYRDPAWRKKVADMALEVHPDDAASVGVIDGGLARLITRRGAVDVTVALSEDVRPGHMTLPNGTGITYPDAGGVQRLDGVAPNELTRSEDRDPIAGTPWHKHVRARLERC